MDLSRRPALNVESTSLNDKLSQPFKDREIVSICQSRSASLLLASWAVFVVSLSTPAEAQIPELKTGMRIVFLGDSNTYAGQYISDIEATVLEQHPGMEIEWLNLGLPSETCSGLSEPDHPFPRPDVHERLERVLKKTEPDLVFACYGMNDGIYYPFSEKRFAAYRSGIQRLIQAAHRAEVPLVLMTPPPFDPQPQMKSGKALPLGAEKYAWFAIYEDYDDVLEQYSKWILGVSEGIEAVIDVRRPMLDELARRRKLDPNYSMSGDGVHFNADGHHVLATAILKVLKVQAGVTKNEDLKKLVHKRQLLMRDAWVTHCGHKRPKTAKGKPLPEARKEAAILSKQIDKVLPGP